MAQPRGHAGPEIAALRRGGEHDGGGLAGLGAVGDNGRVAGSLVEAETLIGHHLHGVGTEPSGLIDAYARRADHQRVHANPGGVRQPARGGQGFVRDFLELAVTLLKHRQHVWHQSTLASVRRAATSAGTASGPSPTMRPSFRAGGSVSSRTATPPASGETDFTSSGFFFAAMIPLRAG